MQDELLAPLIRASPLLFAQLCLEGPQYPPFNGRLLFSSAHLAWEDIITTSNRYVLVASRGSGKSFITTFIHTLWRCATQPDTSGYIFSGTEFAAQRMLEEIKMEIEKNPRLKWLYPGPQSRKWTATQFRASNGHYVTAKGMMTRVRGAHPTYLLADDCMTDEDGWSQAKRSKTIDYFYSTLTNMVLPHGQIGVCGTPFAVGDLLHNLQNNRAYTSGVYPALDDQERSTWSDVYTTQYLLDLRQEIGSVRFARERQCKPVSDESSLFPKALFYEGDIMQPQARLGADLEHWQQLGIERVYIGVDFAFSASVNADYFVICVLGVDERGNRWMMDMYRARGVSFSAQKSMIVTMARRYDPHLLFLESNAAQQVAADELRRETDLPIRKYVMTSKKHSLEDGLPSLRLLLENNKVRIPRGDAKSVEMTDILIEEANNFTWLGGQAKSVGGHDDTVFAFFIAEQAARKGQRSGRLMAGAGGTEIRAPISTSGGIDALKHRQYGAPLAPNTPPAPHPRPLMPQAGPSLAQQMGQGGRTELRNGVYVRVDG